MASLSSASENQQPTCVACLEPINTGARICPHCRSSQSNWHVVSLALKWIGGTVTTVSLMVGVITLSQYYLDWNERRATVAEIAGAADWLIKSENYLQAWQMYGKAAELNPSSASVRDGRFNLSLIWVRNFQVDKSKLDETLNRISEILYRGLRTSDPQKTATILAHVGYVQVIRQINRLNIFTDVESLFEQALHASPNNVYANTMYARWSLLRRPMTVARLDQAGQLYDKALATEHERAYVRSLQFVGFTPYTYAYDDEVERRALTILINACIAMMQNGESQPDPYSRNKILDGYGGSGKAEHVEALITALPPKAHLKAYEWLLQADNDKRARMISQSIYVKARLNEQIGNKMAALDYYQSLLTAETREELDEFVDQGIQRLTGKLPTRAFARNYRDDAIDEQNPSQFHLDTFEHFDPTGWSENFRQALSYFESQIAKNFDQLSALVDRLPTFISQVQKVIRQGDEIEKMKAYTSGFNSTHHDNARQKWVELVLLYAHLLKANDQYEQALAQLGDVLKVISTFDKEWQPTRATLEYELAVLYVDLSAQNNNASDKEQAIRFLLSAVESGIAEHKLDTWQDIKGNKFALLRADLRYQNLIRGR